MTFSAHVSGKQPMKRGLLPANTIPWACECVPAGGDSQKSVRIDVYPFASWTVKLNPGYLKKCIDCGVKRDR